MAVPRVSRWRLGALAVGAMLLLTGCSASSAAGNGNGAAVTVGSQTGLGNEVLAQIYGQSLEAEGYDVSYNYGIGGRSAFLAALEKGTIDVVPDYAGLLLAAVDTDSRAATTSDVMTALDGVLAPLGIEAYTASPAEKSRAFVTTRPFATAHNLRSLSDLAPIATAITIGSTESLDSESYGRDALSFSYDVSGWRARTDNDDAAVIADLLDGTIQVADVSTLEPGIRDNDLVVLSDPAHIVVAQNVVPVVNSHVASSRMQNALDAVSAELTTSDLVSFAHQTKLLPAAIASRWLESKGLAGD